jgi:endonuclease/exonuclease/phosphatase (EEP) superfamily protein YafD
MRPAMTLSSLFWAAADLPGIALSVISLLGFLGPVWHLLDNLSHFRVQYLVFLLPLAAFYGLSQSWWQAALALAFALVNLALVLPLYAHPLTARAAAEEPVYRLFSANVYRNNTQYDLLSQEILRHDPDVVVLSEFTHTWQAALQPVLSAYPYTVLFPQEGYFGLAVLSKYPLQDEQVEYFGGSQEASIVATVKLPAGDLVIIGTHPVPPRSTSRIVRRNQQMAAIADYAASLSIPHLVTGDLNSSSWSPYFQDWLRRSGMRDSRVGFGVQPTWPVDKQPLMRLAMSTTLDHVLVSPEVHVTARSTGAFTGSDHLPVIMDFSITFETSKDLP